MGTMRKSLPFYCGVALRLIALTFFLLTMAAPARSETVPVEPAPPTATVQSTGAWFFQDYINFLPSGIASLFNGYPTGQAACDAYDAWVKSRGVQSGPLAHAPYTFFLTPGNTDQGICVPYNSFSEWLATNHNTFGMYYYQHCPTGYSTNDPRIRGVSSATFTCTNNGTAKQCPSVAAGETPFTLDPGGLTCSRPDKETYTIELDQRDATIEPTGTTARNVKTAQEFTAIVTGSRNGVKSGAAVTIRADVKANTGGHDHHDDNRPKGLLGSENNTASHCGANNEKQTCITGTTNGSGQFTFTFTSSQVSGEHTLTATCDLCAGNQDKAEVKVKVVGLSQILDSEYYALIEDGGTKIIGSTDNHLSNHYLNGASQLQLWNLAQEFYEYQIRNGMPDPTILHINDASLKWGGIFDIDADWVPDHFEHRRGSVVDIRANSSSGAVPNGLTKDFERIAIDLGVDPHLEYENDSVRRHFHTRLLNRRE